MVRVRTAPSPVRFAFSVLLALLIGIRLLVPAGFMPAFRHDTVTIMPCPDAQGGTMPMEREGDHKGLHQPCPYAAASSLGALGADWFGLPCLLFFAVALLLGRAFIFVERHATRERPPAIGPPIGG